MHNAKYSFFKVIDVKILLQMCTYQFCYIRLNNIGHKSIIIHETMSFLQMYLKQGLSDAPRNISVCE